MNNLKQEVRGECENFEKVLKDKMVLGFVEGKPYDQIVKEMEKELGVERWKIERLVRTEGTFISNQASIRGYEYAGIKYYQFIARFDDRTSKICREHHKHIYETEKVMAGENLPPLHAWCRSTTAPVLKDPKKLIEEEINEIKVGKLSEEELKELYNELIGLGDKNSRLIDSVSLHPFYTFEMFKERYYKTFELVNGIEVCGTKIKELGGHQIKRMLERGITPQDLLDALQNPDEISDIEYDKKYNDYKFHITKGNMTVYINPNTGKIITTWIKEN